MLSIGTSIQSITGGAVFQTVETVLATTPQISVPKDSVLAHVQATINLTAGTGTTLISLKLRRGTTTAGLQLNGNDNFTVVAGQTYQICIMSPDSILFAAQAQYCVTGVGTGSTGNSQAFEVDILVLFLQ